jgi:predicted component of type VI protein secretion system
MKLNLVVLTPGKWQGKQIPVTAAEFLIGRDAQCHLRPANPLISQRHCAVRVREGKAFVFDFGSTNGTFVNDERIEGEREVQHGDRLKVGAIAFQVHIESSVPVNKPTPLPPTKVPHSAEEDEAAALLLSLSGGESATSGNAEVDPSGVPTGNTELDTAPPAGSAEGEPGKPGAKGPQAKPPSGDTAAAAKDILAKYMRRGRT